MNKVAVIILTGIIISFTDTDGNTTRFPRGMSEYDKQMAVWGKSGCRKELYRGEINTICQSWEAGEDEIDADVSG